jgi:hypothetical protein
MVISKYTTDDISQLVERPGAGYRIDFTRELVRRLDDRRLLRAVMKLNTAISFTQEPALFSGGISGYVKHLIDNAKGPERKEI